MLELPTTHPAAKPTSAAAAAAEPQPQSTASDVIDECKAQIQRLTARIAELERVIHEAEKVSPMPIGSPPDFPIATDLCTELQTIVQQDLFDELFSDNPPSNEAVVALIQDVQSQVTSWPTFWPALIRAPLRAQAINNKHGINSPSSDEASVLLAELNTNKRTFYNANTDEGLRRLRRLVQESLSDFVPLDTIASVVAERHYKALGRPNAGELSRILKDLLRVLMQGAVSHPALTLDTSAIGTPVPYNSKIHAGMAGGKRLLDGQQVIIVIPALKTAFGSSDCTRAYVLRNNT